MADDPADILYATFPRRVRALVFDAATVVGVLLLIVVVAANASPGQSTRIGLFAAMVVLFVFYEPVLVAARGQTVGHWLCNIRVVAPTPSGRLPFWQAFLRCGMKGATGLASFATMGATQRNQALHDLAFGTTVQIADPTKAGAYDFIHERAAIPPGAMPSRIRRTAVVAGYLVLLILLLTVVAPMAASPECWDHNQCRGAEGLLSRIVATGWFAAVIGACVFGWQGRLPGARRGLSQ
jgi:uncharacterized RDD family membrane protein YckC